MDGLYTILIGSNSAVVLTLVWLVSEVHSLKTRVAKLSDDAAYYRGQFNALQKKRDAA